VAERGAWHSEGYATSHSQRPRRVRSGDFFATL